MKETIVKVNKMKSRLVDKKAFWEDKQNWQIFTQTLQEKKREESNQQN